MYASSFDLEEECEIGGWVFPVYGHFNVDNSGYVLSKKAKIWEANCQEHVFVAAETEDKPFDASYFEKLDAWLHACAEPQFVRHGEKLPPEGHMYTYLTVILLSERSVDEETARAIRKYKFEKMYRFNLRGYSQTRLAIVSLKDGTVITNTAGKPLKKTYQALLGARKSHERPLTKN